ncbi:unnamed protein product [marine sediment metagenome]|uniref:SAP domain-containing protein n=1 Tax=marine sediment metagenome TaxID=412755 RepID=X1Q6S0_9ZZZZ
MAGEIRLNKQGLADLIESIKNTGGDTIELDNLMAGIIEDENARRPVRRMGNPLRILVEEPTTEERLEAEVGELFPSGITEPILAECIEMDGKYTLAELKKMCVEVGLSPSGHKKELAAKLIAKGVK